MSSDEQKICPPNTCFVLLVRRTDLKAIWQEVAEGEKKLRKNWITAVILVPVHHPVTGPKNIVLQVQQKTEIGNNFNNENAVAETSFHSP